MLSKDTLVDLLLKNDKAVARALVVLNRLQTQSEQLSEATIVHNGEGFRPCHARMGTSMDGRSALVLGHQELLLSHTRTT